MLAAARDAGLVTKSNLILGLGEERAEITAALADLRSAGCELVTITQYLRPRRGTTRCNAGSSPGSSPNCATRHWNSDSPA